MKITDKQRLDWLMKNKTDLGCWNSEYWKTYKYGQGFGRRCSTPRAAIDAAINAETKKASRAK